ncbi:MAG TPA: hypothetical protein VJ955_03700 [Desulfuromonadales bacterium]|nr:hypothetical protein [Desulfuromonadales bacterium]
MSCDPSGWFGGRFAWLEAGGGAGAASYIPCTVGYGGYGPGYMGGIGAGT